MFLGVSQVLSMKSEDGLLSDPAMKSLPTPPISPMDEKGLDQMDMTIPTLLKGRNELDEKRKAGFFEMKEIKVALHPDHPLEWTRSEYSELERRTIQRLTRDWSFLSQKMEHHHPHRSTNVCSLFRFRGLYGRYGEYHEGIQSQGGDRFAWVSRCLNCKLLMVGLLNLASQAITLRTRLWHRSNRMESSVGSKSFSHINSNSLPS